MALALQTNGIRFVQLLGGRVAVRCADSVQGSAWHVARCTAERRRAPWSALCPAPWLQARKAVASFRDDEEVRARRRCWLLGGSLPRLSNAGVGVSIFLGFAEL